MQQTLVLHTQNSATFVLCTQKNAPKSRPKKRWQKGGKKAAKKVARKAAKKHAKKAHFHIHNTYVNHQKKKLLEAYS